MADLSQVAIQSALAQDWDQAIEINKMILEQNASDSEAQCRLAYAYSQRGNVEEAKKIYRKILANDRYHPIAKKNLDRINAVAKSGVPSVEPTRPRISPQLFLEEPGKTKTVTLRNVAPVQKLATMHIGDMVMLFAKNHSVEVRDHNKVYLGALPDDIAFRMIRFLKAGNDYQVCIKNIHKNSVSVFIRETRRSKRTMMQTTFALTANGTDASHHSVKRIEKAQIPASRSEDDAVGEASSDE